MPRSVFCPPNSQFLSDDVIGSICQRPTQVQSIRATNTNADRNCTTPPSGWAIPARISPAEDEDSISPRDKKRKRNGATADSDSTTHRQEDQDEEVKINSISMKKSVDLTKVAQLLDLGEELQRKRRRETQKRYRMRQIQLTTNLENDVHQLRQDIEKLLQQRDSGTEATRDAWNVALEFYARSRRLKTQNLYNLFEFLRATTAPDVAFSGGIGRERFANSWSILRWFDQVDVDLHSLKKYGDDCVVMTTRTRMTMTGRTLQNLFPRLYNCAESSVKVRLVTKLVDQQIVMDSRTLFQWDSATKLVTGVRTDSDLLTPLLGLLGRLEDVSIAFDQALISPDFQWR
ncbi:hypothetical protein F442_14980 [Phytophthora nicotianae P10297]|uniref:BZIP domain-containing protein n=4 Tax=Phytophthora nicotianae TaxID=4792 RepID=W2Q678_PHYN3|nr:hypothetical protein PPTG_12152 [Phytophthora nicotianae INRA-310]ETI46421.1 hypothetical protein F443_09193 [Phytophthora nicotianae P1569]ETK86355.1 hypothetical protein L915_09016 [Phytophthora nicotianae]ETP37215.1 hypothetical protein F442_14980 [Phytophthora nicotianae P10297]ETL39772.1 hypothetical protein L916_08931 [Phytophthora nicotianae]ETL92879.1 hypothetical protein L917_08862 [Phytophthora nicotianae]